MTEMEPAQPLTPILLIDWLKTSTKCFPRSTRLHHQLVKISQTSLRPLTLQQLQMVSLLGHRVTQPLLLSHRILLLEMMPLQHQISRVTRIVRMQQRPMQTHPVRSKLHQTAAKVPRQLNQTQPLNRMQLKKTKLLFLQLIMVRTIKLPALPLIQLLYPIATKDKPATRHHLQLLIALPQTQRLHRLVTIRQPRNRVYAAATKNVPMHTDHMFSKDLSWHATQVESAKPNDPKHSILIVF